jgi:Domain of unknown function (DUF4034)
MSRLRFVTTLIFFALIAIAANAGDAKAAGAATTTSTLALPTSQPSADSLPEAPIAFSRGMEQLLLARRFDQLGEIAEQLRSTQKRWPGGRWVLTNFYEGVGTPAPGSHPTEEDWTQHMKLVEEWVSAKPSSITARIALAESWQGYAWFARGSGHADKVTDNGWKAFAERLVRTKQVLDSAAKLDAKDPHWYRVMFDVSLGQGWEMEQEAALYKQAIAFEPGYYSYYRAMGRYLAPQWNGEEGDAARYAAKTADAIGGETGDIIYFEVASELICGCSVRNSPIKTMDWTRLKRGFETARKKYGTSYIQLNQIALMSVVFADTVAADDYIREIGDQRDDDIWKKSYFDSIKEWAADYAPMERMEREATIQGAENMKTPEGQQFLAEFWQIMSKTWPTCVANLKEKLPPFQVKLRLAADGTVNRSGMYDGSLAPLLGCAFKPLMTQKPFSIKPPHGDYWLVFDLDPAQAAAPATLTPSSGGN